MRIARIELDQIGPFDAAALDIPAPAHGQCGELVLFEGPNGSGKTALLQAIACAAARDPTKDGFALMPPHHELGELFRAPSGAIRVTLDHDGETFPVTLLAG